MRKNIIKKLYYKITFDKQSLNTNSDLIISIEDGITRISSATQQTISSAVSPVNPNRTVRRSIKKTITAKKVDICT